MSGSIRSTSPRIAGCQSATARDHRLVHRPRRLRGPLRRRRDLDPGRDRAVEHHVRARRRRSVRRRPARRPPRPPAGGGASGRPRASSRGRRETIAKPAFQTASGSSARPSSVSGERPNSPSAPTGAGMIGTSGISGRRTAEPTPSAATSTSPSALRAVGEPQPDRVVGRRRRRRPPRRGGRSPRVRRGGSAGTCAGRCWSAAAPRSPARRCGASRSARVPCGSTTTERSWPAHRLARGAHEQLVQRRRAGTRRVRRRPRRRG